MLSRNSVPFQQRCGLLTKPPAHVALLAPGLDRAGSIPVEQTELRGDLMLDDANGSPLGDRGRIDQFPPAQEV